MTEHARQTLRGYKSRMRDALAASTDSQLVDMLTAARAGRVPFMGATALDLVEECGCFAQRLGKWVWFHERKCIPRNQLSDAYSQLIPWGCADQDGRRQRILVAMCLAEIRQRTKIPGLDAPIEDAGTLVATPVLI